MLERLEGRQLLSVSIDVSADSVRIAGDARPDEIVVRQEANELVVTHNGTRQAVPVGTARFLNIDAGAGRDRVTVENTSLQLWVSGGRGNDRIEVGATDADASCGVEGGPGRDLLLGSGGDDELFGDAGNDTVLGRGGDDTVTGGTGNDTLDGGDGNDKVWDRQGNDRLSGGAGDDVLGDAVGSNRFAGGDGADACTVRGSARAVGADVETVWRVSPRDADPMVGAFVTRSAEGDVSVVVDAWHSAGGYRRDFGELESTPTGFRLQVTGTDLAGPHAGRTLAIEVETRTYALDRLAPGSYEFVIRSRDVVRHLFHIGVTPDGLTPDTPTTPGPYHTTARPWAGA